MHNMRLVISLALLNLVTATSIDRFTGKWLPIATFPNVVSYPICDKYNITIQKNTACTCGSLTATLLKSEKGPSDIQARPITMPIIIVERIEEITPALAQECRCGDEPKHHVVYRSIDDNYYVVYEKHPQNVYTTEELNTANLLVKNPPSMGKLREVIKNIPDLKNRSTGIMCDPDKIRR